MVRLRKRNFDWDVFYGLARHRRLRDHVSLDVVVRDLHDEKTCCSQDVYTEMWHLDYGLIRVVFYVRLG